MINASYEKIYHLLMDDILTGKFLPGQKLPSIRRLAELTHCNPATVQHGIKILKQKGLVETNRNRGTFVIDNLVQIEEVRQQEHLRLACDVICKLHTLEYSTAEICTLLKKYHDFKSSSS